MLLINLAYFALACICMIIAGTYLVKSLNKIAQFLKITEFAAAFIIMAVATSLPELFVGINSAIKGETAVILGTIIGANIVDLTIIIGIPILIARGIKIKRKETPRDSFYMFFIAVLPLVLFFIGKQISRIDAIILIFVFLIYSARIIKRKEKYTKKLQDGIKRWDMVLTTITFIILLVVLFVSAIFVVKYAIEISTDLKIPVILVGLFLIAFGTTLPELVFGIESVKLGHPDMALGDIIGTVISNSTLIIAITALIRPIQATFTPFLISAIFLIIIAAIFSSFCISKKKLSLREGTILIFIYILFIIFEVFVKKGI